MICSSMEADGKGGYTPKKHGRICNHRDKILDFIIALSDMNKKAAEFVTSKTNHNLSKLLTTEIAWGGHKMLLLHRVFFELCETYMT